MKAVAVGIKRENYVICIYKYVQMNPTVMYNYTAIKNNTYVLFNSFYIKFKVR